MKHGIVVEIWYPRNEEREIDHVRIELIDVRAANQLVVDYDFDRDGWRLQMPQEHDDNALIEVGFIPAWKVE